MQKIVRCCVNKITELNLENNNLLFNWKLMAALRVLDYVVVHELTHIEQKNHSRRFWNMVKVVLFDYDRSKTWLRENKQLLNI